MPVQGAIDLRLVAQRQRLSLQALRELNPALLHDITPPQQRTVLRVPRQQGKRVAAWLAALPARCRLAYQQIKVVRGDTLFGLARRYRADLQALREINQIQRSHLRPGQLLVIPSIAHPTGRSRARVVRAKAPAPRRRGSTLGHGRTQVAAKARRGRHVVAQGETLWSIARRYGISVDRIKRSRRGPRLFAGDVLEIM